MSTQPLPDISSFQILETTLYTKCQGLVLLDAHVSRMKQSARQLAEEYGAPGAFAFNENTAASFISNAATERLTDREIPHRVRVLLDSCGNLDIQVTPEATAASAEVFLVLDQQPTADSVFVRCKTTFRPMYTDAAARLPAEYSGAQVLLYNAQGEITEGNIANVAVGMPDSSTGEMRLVTPLLCAGLLPGTMRASLLESGQIVEGRITVAQFKHAAEQGWPVMCMNSVRGLYKVTPIILN
ncbi:hypothetical protein GGH94_005639 [Coemansia aciculifera]|uniref:D-aminoacid aminotransferase-like PLP-dependent enzyme n=1 Tax=Coemansia aciculifera TaxID=417176 RepID=A0A9W8IL17_9FUNG|nr:hypothetical protein GGH94_005639 [Coemansia aciculifera]